MDERDKNIEVETAILGEAERLKQYFVHNRVGLNYRATLAVEMAKIMAVNGAASDGYANDGASRLRPMTAPEIVAKAVDIADLLVNSIEAKGWTVVVPTLKDLVTSGSRAGFMSDMSDKGD